MKKILLGILPLIFAITSCVPVIAPGNIKTGGAFYIDAVEGVQQVENNNRGYKKYGKACVKNFAYLFTIGDASIDQAKRNGHMQKIYRIEREKKGFGGLLLMIFPAIYTKSCTIVYGE